VDIENVAGIRFAPRRTPEQEGKLTVSARVMGEVIVTISTSRPAAMKYSAMLVAA